nr:3207_t:CDS:2 [Entrophospora candida]CAG8475008.1 9602_t:CDS:2 [Entrophospora candida]
MKAEKDKKDKEHNKNMGVNEIIILDIGGTMFQEKNKEFLIGIE